MTALPGRGLEASVEGHVLLIGTRRCFDEHAIVYQFLQEQMEQLERQGKTVMLVACDGKAAGLVAVTDRVKVGSAEAIRHLQRQGIDVFMITGDNIHTASAIAEQVGIATNQVMAEVLPEEKARHVKDLQSSEAARGFCGRWHQ